MTETELCDGCKRSRHIEGSIYTCSCACIPNKQDEVEVDCKYIRCEGAGCSLNNNCTYPNCTPKDK